MAAQSSAAGTDAAQHFRLISDADLTQFDPHLKDAGQIFNEFPEVHAPVRGKVKITLVLSNVYSTSIGFISRPLASIFSDRYPARSVFSSDFPRV